MDLAAWGPTIVAIISAIFIAGQVAGRIKDQEKTLKRHDDILDEHGTKIDEHSIAIAEGNAWRRGYDAARSKS